GWMVYLIVRHRSRPTSKEPDDAPRAGALPTERGTVTAALIMTVVVTALLIPLSIGTIQTVDLIEKPPEKGSVVVTVEGFQWGWKFTYPNGKEVIGELRVPVGEVVVLQITSVDVFHNLGVVDFKIKGDAIPGRVNTLWFDPQETGVYEMLCFEFCGVGHTEMRANLIVMDSGEFEDWLAII
ncbi:MAG: cytochrome c oxidase subunit II, partial [Dehalococcoidia bacterium]